MVSFISTENESPLLLASLLMCFFQMYAHKLASCMKHSLDIHRYGLEKKCVYIIESLKIPWLYEQFAKFVQHFVHDYSGNACM